MQLRHVLLGIGVLALIAGVALALLWAAQRQLSQERAPAAEARPSPPADVEAVLTAARDLPSGTLLRPEDMMWTDIPASRVQADTILRERDAEGNFLGALVSRDFTAGEPLLRSGLIKPSDRAFLAALLSPGSRAVTIPVDVSQSASGLVLPDNRVDIILTQTFGDDADPARKTVGETVLRNLRVIAVDQRLGQPAPGPPGSAKPESAAPRTITLEVGEREAETLIVASKLGRLEVAVRALGRGESDGHPDAAASDPTWAGEVSPALRSLARTLEGPARAGAAAPRPQSTIEVMHGDKIERR